MHGLEPTFGLCVNVQILATHYRSFRTNDQLKILEKKVKQ